MNNKPLIMLPIISASRRGFLCRWERGWGNLAPRPSPLGREGDDRFVLGARLRCRLRHVGLEACEIRKPDAARQQQPKRWCRARLIEGFLGGELQQPLNAVPE